MSSEFGKNIRVSIFGQSHGDAIGVVIDGLPVGEAIDMGELAAFMARRAPGRDATTTPRKEADTPKILSGLLDGKTCGAPLAAIIENTNTRSSDYSAFEACPRPGHADYSAFVRYGGMADMRGGGHFSGRLTAPLCIAGGIAKQILSRKGIEIVSHIAEIAGVKDAPLAMDKDMFARLQKSGFPVVDADAEAAMRDAIAEAAAAQDSVGGVVEVMAMGVPAGVGDPMFGGLESELAKVMFGVPAVRGVEFGAGFAAAGMRGSEHNDAFTVKDGKVATVTNNHGGILGGITTGMPIVMRAAFKPTPTIGKEQDTVNMVNCTQAVLAARGRHDPCIVSRAAAVAEAVMACVILDKISDTEYSGGRK